MLVRFICVLFDTFKAISNRRNNFPSLKNKVNILEDESKKLEKELTDIKICLQRVEKSNQEMIKKLELTGSISPRERNRRKIIITISILYAVVLSYWLYLTLQKSYTSDTVEISTLLSIGILVSFSLIFISWSSFKPQGIEQILLEGISTELIGASITALLFGIIVWTAQINATKLERKNELVRLMGSIDNQVAKQASEELWILDGRTDGTLNCVSLPVANLQGVDLWLADFRGANLESANFSEGNLGEANLAGAIMTNAKLRNTRMHGAILFGTNLSHATLYGADLRGAHLGNTNISDALVDEATIMPDGKSGRDLAYLMQFNLQIQTDNNSTLIEC